MPDIRTVDVHTDITLTNFAISWGDPLLIAPQVLPTIPVDKRSNKYPIYEAESFRLVADARGENDIAVEMDFPLSSDTYYCKDHALRRFLSDQVLRNADDPGALRAISLANRVKQLKRLVARGWESEIATLLCTAGHYAAGLYEDLDSIATHNFDDTGVNGLATLLAYMDAVEIACGMLPDTLVVSSDCWQKLQLDANFRSIIAQPQINTAALAGLLGVRQVLIARGIYSTAAKGRAPVMARLWPSNWIVGLISPAGASAENPATAATFLWNAFPGSANGETVQTYRDAARGGGGEWVEYSQYRDVKASGVNAAGAFISAFALANVYASI